MASVHLSLPPELEALDTASLSAKLDEITRNNDYLKKENATLEAYLHRHVTPEEAEEWAEDDHHRGRGRKHKSKKSRVGGVLTIDQRLDIVTAEQDALKKEISTAETQSTRMIDALRAMLEQTDLRIAALKHEAYEFKRDVVIGGQHPRNGKTMAEKVVKFFEEQIRAKDALADKLRLKNQTLRAQLSKLEASLRQKEEAGDVLHYIDFHQLQIENKQHLARIEERNNELLRLKLSTAQTIQALNGMKARLSESARAIVRLRAEMKARGALLTKLQGENGTLAEAVSRAQEQAELMMAAARASSELPTVTDYIELTALQTGLHKELASARRKMEIAELTAHQATLKAQQAGLRLPSLAATVPPLSDALSAVGGAGGPSSAASRGGGSASGAPSSLDDDASGTRRSGRRDDVDIFAGGGTGTGGGSAMGLATGPHGSASSGTLSSLSTGSHASRTPVKPAAGAGGGLYSPLAAGGTVGRSSGPGGGLGATAAAGTARGGIAERGSTGALGLGRPIGGRDTARLPGASSQVFVPGQSAPLPKAVAGFGGGGKGTLRLGLATTLAGAGASGGGGGGGFGGGGGGGGGGSSGPSSRASSAGTGGARGGLAGRPPLGTAGSGR